MKRLLPALLVLVLVTIGCADDGGGADGALEEAQEHLLDAESGHFSLTLEGEREGEPVGITVDGSFSYEESEYPKVDVDYDRRRGTERSENTFRSDGTAAWIIEGAVVTPVSLQALQGLREREGIAATVPDLHIAAWVEDPERTGDVIRGRVDVGALVGDLRVLAAETDGNRADAELPDAAAERLREALRDSSIEVRLGDDGEFRSLVAVLDFGDEIPEDVDRGLASYAASRLELRMTLEPLDEPLEVEQPGATDR